MALTKRPKAASVEAFIAAAPDAAPQVAAAPAARAPIEPRPSSGRKKPISLTIEPALLAELDHAADKLGISRAAAFSLAVSRFVASEKRGAQ